MKLLDAKCVYTNRRGYWLPCKENEDIEDIRQNVCDLTVPNVKYRIRDIDDCLQRYYDGKVPASTLLFHLKLANAELVSLQKWIDSGSVYVSLGEGDSFKKIPLNSNHADFYRYEDMVLIMKNKNMIYYFHRPTGNIIARDVSRLDYRVIAYHKTYKEAKALVEADSNPF